jgi:hypothetical protein
MHKLSQHHVSVHQLVSLLAYARSHRHSAAWIPAILNILARKESAHG